MQRCENGKCLNGSPRGFFEPTKPARSKQRFCSAACRKAWHYRDRKAAKYRWKVEKAEDRGGAIGRFA